MLILIKIIASAAAVLGLSIVSEKLSPRIAGVLAGLPLGLALSLFFIGVEQGDQFVEQAATSALGGLGATLVFLIAYWIFSDIFSRFRIILAGFFATIVYLIAASAIALLPQERWLLLIVTLVLARLMVIVMREVIDERVDPEDQVNLTLGVLINRSAAAAFAVVFITGLASTVGPAWSGIFSSFPITLLPLLIIVQISYSDQHAYSIIKHFPYGMGSLAIYALATSYLVLPLGIYVGSVLALVLAIMYLCTYLFLSGR
ncbi:MAG: hypothetical protein ABJN26_02480 [Stappiaceae bacterium]